MSKRLVINAYGVGNSYEINTAAAEVFNLGLLKSITIQPSGIAFDDAVKKLLPQLENISKGICLNITSGKSLCQDLNFLCDEDSNFNKSFYYLFFKIYGKDGELFLTDIEREFRRQIEITLSKTPISHIDSLDYIHSIPKIFNLVCKLAKEYKIPYVCTHFEGNYFVPDIYKHFNIEFIKNFSTRLVLNVLSAFNEDLVLNYNLKTNDFYIGIAYKADMDLMSVIYGAKSINYDNTTVEISLHPCRYENGLINNHFSEYLILKNNKLINEFTKFGYELTNYAE